MLCDKCKKNEASVFYKEYVNGQKKSFALCEKCAAEAEKSSDITKGFMGGAFSDPFEDMNSIFTSLFGLPQYAKKPAGETKKCGLCGAGFRDLVAEGKAGCPECYKTFAEELTGTIHKIHGSTTHTGSAPGKYREDRELKEKVAALEAQLREAVEREEYEKAATVRDELKALRGASGKEGA